ncbi:MAG TPA: DUF3570 domain-containing protein [Woeseiaceae bacterium]|nr:DUF3570 domain-containing protein [Woeseiaceae bacterium]
MHRRPAFYLLAFLALAGGSRAGVLPDDRGDVMYHSYVGGGVEIDGPSVLVRKKVGSNFSFVGNYYVDYVSSASIDVVTQASPYTEQRNQWSLGMDYLRGNTTMSVNYTNSEESDFDAKTFGFAVSQDLFGDLTTLTLSYAYGDDLVRRSDDPTFQEPATRQMYGIGVTQILTRDLIATLNFETATDEGYLNNPYRSVRYLDPGSPLGYSWEPEVYPHTRTSNALGIRARYYLPYRAAVELEVRGYTDTWDIDGLMGAIMYVHPYGPWTFTAKYRYHGQNSAHFYRDIFLRPQATNFRGRDKELSELYSNTYSIRASYQFIDENKGWNFVKKGTVTAAYDRLDIKYPDFTNLLTGGYYVLDANVVQLFVSFWY